MARPGTPIQILKAILAIHKNNPKWKAPRILKELQTQFKNTEFYIKIPGTSKIRKEINKFEHHTPSDLDKPWSLQSMRQYGISPEAIPVLLFFQQNIKLFYQLRLSDDYLGTTQADIDRVSVLTIRRAIWISNLLRAGTRYPLSKPSTELTYEDLELIAPWLRTKRLPNASILWPDDELLTLKNYLDRLLIVSLDYCEYEKDCELLGIEDQNTCYFDAPLIEDIRLNFQDYMMIESEKLFAKIPRHKQSFQSHTLNVGDKEIELNFGEIERVPVDLKLDKNEFNKIQEQFKNNKDIEKKEGEENG
jgi:hypothetical protein